MQGVAEHSAGMLLHGSHKNRIIFYFSRQPYLPQVYVESDSDATNCYLFFQRLSAKADLINNIVAQIHGLPETLNGPVADLLVGICEVKFRSPYMVKGYTHGNIHR